MAQNLVVELAVLEEFDRLRLPDALNQRLQQLLDRQDRGEALNEAERTKADGPVDLAESLSVIGLRASPLSDAV